MFYSKFGFRHTAADAVDSVIFGMRNPLTANPKKEIRIRRVIWTIGFDGTAVALTRVGYGLARYNTADMTGGTSPARVNSASAGSANSVIADVNIKNGAALTITSVVFESNFHECLIPTQPTNAAVAQDIEFEDDFILKPGEGLCVRLAVVAAIGVGVAGCVQWRERPI